MEMVPWMLAPKLLTAMMHIQPPTHLYTSRLFEIDISSAFVHVREVSFPLIIWEE